MSDPNDPHAELHELAAHQHEDHPEALGDSAGDESIEEKLAKLDQRLTARINDLRKDFDATKKAISKSVQTVADELGTLKTKVENNAASIEAQNNLIEVAEKKADTAHKAADEAAQKADTAAQKAATVEKGLSDLANAYRAHTHPVTFTFNGETQPPEGGK